MLDNYKKRVMHLVNRPESISSLCVSGGAIDNADLASILQLPESELGFQHFNLFFEGTFVEGLYFVPAALEYCSSMKDEYSQVADHLLRLLCSYKSEFKDVGLFEDTLSEILKVFWRWISVFKGQEILETGEDRRLILSACVVGAEERDAFLEALLKSQLTLNAENAFQLNLQTWSSDCSSASRSANFLSLLFNWRSGWITTLKMRLLASNSLISEYSNQNALCNAHWSIARELVMSECPADYTSSLKRCLQIA